MKNITVLSLAIAGCFMAACTDNDDTQPPVVQDISGTYRLASFNAPVAQDLNDDDQSSFNLVTENDCYTQWELQLNSDNSYSRIGKVISIADGNIVCESETDSGTWARNNDSVTLSNLEGSQIGTEFSYIDASKSLTQTMSGNFPLQFEQTYTMEAGTITLIYVKDEGN
ncbi:MAG TPA: lipocalin family protein [Flavobacterium sp.]|jgi:hypothetical protein|nr:lipocalin family protein [Flavobacterium sp.]